MADVLADNLSVTGSATFSSTNDDAVAIGGALGTTVPPGPVRVNMVRGGLAGGALVGVFFGQMNGAGGSIQGVEGYVVSNPGVGETLFQALPAPANSEFIGAGQLTWSKNGGLVLNSTHATGVVKNYAAVYRGKVARLAGNVAVVEKVYGVFLDDLTDGGGSVETWAFYSAGPAPSLLGGALEVTDTVTSEGFKHAHGGTDYDVLPAMTLTAPPSPAQIAAAPEGCLFIVAP